MQYIPVIDFQKEVDIFLRNFKHVSKHLWGEKNKPYHFLSFVLKVRLNLSLHQNSRQTNQWKISEQRCG